MFRGNRPTLLILILLTVIAAILRFTALDRPSIWGDEAATYGRTAGTYQQMLDQLDDAVFPPLHYEAEWWIAQGMPYWGTFEPPKDVKKERVFTPTKFLVPGGIRLKPFVLRFIPALAGTLFVPAIFWLTVQLFGRRVALIAATLACFSAYLLVYSRDAKMYMHFWLFVTLHVASLLWWVRTRKTLAWAVWMLCGVIMVGLHATGFMLLAIDAIVVFTTPGQYWLMTDFWPLGRRGRRYGFWTALTLPLFGHDYYRKRFLPKSMFHALRPIQHWARRSWLRFRMPRVVPFVVGVLVILSAGFGPLGFYSSFSQRMQHVTAEDRGTVGTGELGINWVGRYNIGRQLPDYLLYTASAYLTGWEWPRQFGLLEFKGVPLDTNEQDLVNPRRLWLLKAATVSLLSLLAIGLIPWRRIFNADRASADRLSIDGRLAVPFIRRRVLWIAVWMTTVYAGCYAQSFAVPSNLFDGAAKALLNQPPVVSWPRLPVNAGTEVIGPVWEKIKAAWHVYASAWTGENLNRGAVASLTLALVALAVLIAFKRQMIGRGAWRLLVALLVAGVVSLVLVLLPRKVDDSVWMPRYVGTALPAFFILIAVLIDRQPNWLRWVTIPLFVVVNLGQFSARVWGGSEPPLAQMAADVVASQPKKVISSNPEKPAVRTYIGFRTFVADPGGANLFTPSGRYYLREWSGIDGSIFDIRYGAFERNLQINRFVEAGSIASDLRNRPEVQKLIVWTMQNVGEIDNEEPIGDLLYGKFRRVSDDKFIARDHWRWIERWQFRRRVYERVVENASARKPG